MTIDDILKSLEQPEAKPYTPDFAVREDPRGWRLFDGDTALAVFMPSALDIWSFSPFEPPEMANLEEPGQVVDLHTVHNTYLNLGLQGWPEEWLEGASDPQSLLNWQWRQKEGPAVEALVSGEFPQGERCQWRVTVRYDPAWARYRYAIDINARRRSADGLEALNMMLAGALMAREEGRRWTHSIWQAPDGQLRRLVHSNALFQCTDYGDPSWRTRNAPFRGAWVGYAAHESFNPAVLIHGNNVPIILATCSQLFDEHVIWGTAGLDNLRDDGYFHFAMQTEFVNLPPQLARELLEQAVDPVQPRAWWNSCHALPFHMDTVNSFEETVDPWEPETCPILQVPDAPGSSILRATDEAHSGTHSIRLRVSTQNGRELLEPRGAVCNVKTHTRYRLSGWVKTRAVERFARLELYSYEYTYPNVINTAASQDLAGDQDWTRVEVELDSGDQAYLMPRMMLHGPGEAWFDDLLLEEIG